MSEKSVRIRREQNNGAKVIKTEAVINAVAQSGKLIIYSQAYTQLSIFQVILEECSSKEIDLEEYNGQYHQNMLFQHQIFKEQVPRSPNIWFMLDEVPCDDILDEQLPVKQDACLQFHKVKSFREDQQTKIAQFLREDKYKSLRSIEIPLKNSSPEGKPSQSLSPRKTKKIDKVKSQKYMVQSD